MATLREQMFASRLRAIAPELTDDQIAAILSVLREERDEAIEAATAEPGERR